ILDDVSLPAVDAAGADRQVAHDFVLEASRRLMHGLRTQPRIDRCRSGAEIDCSYDRLSAPRHGRIYVRDPPDASHDIRPAWGIYPIHVEVLVGLAVFAACAHVQIKRDRSLKVLGVIAEDLAATIAGEVKDRADARLHVAEGLVELEVPRAFVP